MAAATLEASDIPDAVTDRAAHLLVDTLAVSLAGSRSSLCREYADSLGASARGGAASVVGVPYGVTPEIAALLNTMPTTVLQIDEGHRTSGSHPAIQVGPAALAVAEDVDAEGTALLAAFVRGYEVAARIALALAPMHGAVHPNGTSGTVGAAVAAGSLWGLDHDRLAATVSAVASMPLAPRLASAFEGHSVLHLYAATGAMTAVATARAARFGLTASARALDDHFLPRLAGREVRTSEAFELTRSYFKYAAACAHVHTPLEALESITGDGALSYQAIDRIEVRTYAIASMLDDPEPVSDLGARFSIPFFLARRLVRGPWAGTVVGPAELTDAPVLDLSKRIVVIHDPELDDLYPSRRPARVSVTTTDGALLRAACDLPQGDADRPVPEEVWRRKIQSLVPALGDRLLELADLPPAAWRARDLGQILRAFDRS